MSLQCAVKHALVGSQQVLNVVFSVVPSSSPGIHRVSPPQLLHSKSSLPALQQLPKSFYLHVQILVSFRANGGMRTCPPVSPQCAEHTQSREGAPVPRNEDLHPPPPVIPDFHCPGSSGKLMGSFSSPSLV